MGRTCLSCATERRDELDAKLRALYDEANGDLGRVPYGAMGSLGDEFGISPTSLKRHFVYHLAMGWADPNEMRSTESEIVARAVAATREAREANLMASDPNQETAEMSVAELTVIINELKDSVERCRIKQDERGLRDGAAAESRAIMHRAKLQGFLEKRQECPELPPVLESAEFAAVLARLMGALDRFPQAKAAVVVALESLTE